MKRRNKKKISSKAAIIIIVVSIIILFFPIRKTYFDGGTVTYTSIMYKLIFWNKIDSYYESGYKTNSEIHIFPTNFRSLDYYYEKDIHPYGLLISSNTDNILANIGSYNWCNKYNKCKNVETAMISDINGYHKLKVSQGETLKLLSPEKITSFKMYKDNTGNEYIDNIDYDIDYMKAPYEKGLYLISMEVYYGKNNVRYYFAIEVE